MRRKDSQLEVLQSVDDDFVGSILGVEPGSDSEESRSLTGDDGDLRRGGKRGKVQDASNKRAEGRRDLQRNQS